MLFLIGLFLGLVIGFLIGFIFKEFFIKLFVKRILKYTSFDLKNNDALESWCEDEIK